MTEFGQLVGWVLIGLCVLSLLIAVWGWWFITSQVRKDELMRQEVREALAGSFFLLEPNYMACFEHNTVFIDFCPDCRVAEIVALTRPGYVVHSD